MNWFKRNSLSQWKKPENSLHWVHERMLRGERPVFLRATPSITSFLRGPFPGGVHNGSYIHILPAQKPGLFELRYLVDPIMSPNILGPIEISKNVADQIIDICKREEDNIPPEERMSYYAR